MRVERRSATLTDVTSVAHSRWLLLVVGLCDEGVCLSTTYGRRSTYADLFELCFMFYSTTGPTLRNPAKRYREPCALDS